MRSKKDDTQIASLTHLLKSMDWLNDYEEQKIAEKVLQAQIDNLNITLQNVNSNHTNNKVPTSVVTSSAATYEQSIHSPLTKYKSYIGKLHSDGSVEGSLTNLSIWL